jgi:hypothetical protein
MLTLSQIKKVEDRAYVGVVERVSESDDIAGARRLVNLVLRNGNGALILWLDSNEGKGT